MRLFRRRIPSEPPEAPIAHEPRPAGHVIELDYPVHPRPRFGHGLPPHAGLVEILESGRSLFSNHVDRILELKDHLAKIAVTEPSSPEEPAWCNGWLPGLDSAALYSFVVHGEPRTYLEVGSGNSTKFCRRAIRDHGLSTRVISIDPVPRAEVDAICDEMIRSPLEEVDLTVFDQLVAGDIVFVDNSHRVFTNSDAAVVFFEVLPRLAPGVLIEFHDIFLPDDYPAEWNDRFYTEQYVLAAYLLGGDRFITTELPCWYVAHDPELRSRLDALWSSPGFDPVERHGNSFWTVKQ